MVLVTDALAPRAACGHHDARASRHLASAHLRAARDRAPAVLPEGLTHAFATEAAKRAQWAGFLRKSHLTAPDLVEVVASVADAAAAGVAAARSTP
jgi:hypothetical protein